MSATAPPAPVAVGILYQVLLRQQARRLRLVALAGLGVLAIVLALVARGGDDPTRDATQLIADYGLAVVAPVSTLWVASSMLGDITEDRLLAYLWLKPLPRWQLAAAAYLASITIVLPLVVVPLIAAAAVSGIGALVAATAAASTLLVLAYGGAFTWLGARFGRGLWWGLLYVLVWENGIARIADGTARLAIRSYGVTILSEATDVSLRLADRARWATVVIPLAVALAGVAATTHRLERADVD